MLFRNTELTPVNSDMRETAVLLHPLDINGVKVGPEIGLARCL